MECNKTTLFFFLTKNDAWWNHFEKPAKHLGFGCYFVNQHFLRYFWKDTALLKSSCRVTKISDSLAWNLLHQAVAYGFKMLFFISVVRKRLCFVSTEVLIIKMPCSTKPNSGVTRIAIIFVVTKDTNSCCATRCRRFKILLVTICLQRCLLNQLFPRITTQWLRAVCTPSATKEYIEGVGVFVDGDLINFMTDLHSEADLGGG